MNAFFFRTCYTPIYWFPFYNGTRKVLWQIDMLKSHGDITIPNQRCNMPVMSHLPFAHVLPAQRRVNQQVASRERSCSTSRLFQTLKVRLVYWLDGPALSAKERPTAPDLPQMGLLPQLPSCHHATRMALARAPRLICRCQRERTAPADWMEAILYESPNHRLQ